MASRHGDPDKIATGLVGDPMPHLARVFALVSGKDGGLATELGCDWPTWKGRHGHIWLR